MKTSNQFNLKKTILQSIAFIRDIHIALCIRAKYRSVYIDLYDLYIYFDIIYHKEIFNIANYMKLKY